MFWTLSSAAKLKVPGGIYRVRISGYDRSVWGLIHQQWGRFPEQIHSPSQAQCSILSSEARLRCKPTKLSSLLGENWWEWGLLEKKTPEWKTLAHWTKQKDTHTHTDKWREALLERKQSDSWFLSCLFSVPEPTVNCCPVQTSSVCSMLCIL